MKMTETGNSLQMAVVAALRYEERPFQVAITMAWHVANPLDPCRRRAIKYMAHDITRSIHLDIHSIFIFVHIHFGTIGLLVSPPVHFGRWVRN